MSKKISILLPGPMPAAHDCLPHAAMMLGNARGSTTRPSPGSVARLVVQEQMGNWVLYRLDADGGFVGDTWHVSREDAFRQASNEFGVDFSAPEHAGQSSDRDHG